METRASRRPANPAFEDVWVDSETKLRRVQGLRQILSRDGAIWEKELSELGLGDDERPAYALQNVWGNRG